MEKAQRWYAVYTKPRWEKKIWKFLLEQEIISYCPLNKVRRKWSDRYKLVEEPLFKSYVFVKIAEDEMGKVRSIPGVVNFVYWNGKPAVIQENEVNIIKRFLNDYKFVEAEPFLLERNQRIKILSGVLMDEEGVVLKAEKNTVQVILTSLGFKLKASLRRNEIELITD